MCASGSIRRLSVSVIEGGGDAVRTAPTTSASSGFSRLNMGVFKFKFSMNLQMNLSTQLQIILALAVWAWAVMNEQLEIGGVAAFISGIGRITDLVGRSGQLLS